MKLERQVRGALLKAMKMVGQTILLHRNPGSPDETVTEVLGLKNCEKDRPEQVMFHFPERVEIQEGDVLQVKGSQDLWAVLDTEDYIQGDTLIYFEAKVEKLSKDGKRRETAPTGSAVFHGPVMGGVQVGGSQNVQTVTVTSASKVNEDIGRLVKLIESSDLPQLHKDDAVEALNRIKQLDGEEKTDEVLKRVKDRLGVVQGVLGTGKDLVAVAAPILNGIAQYFGMPL